MTTLSLELPLSRKSITTKLDATISTYYGNAAICSPELQPTVTAGSTKPASNIEVGGTSSYEQGHSVNFDDASSITQSVITERIINKETDSSFPMSSNDGRSSSLIGKERFSLNKVLPSNPTQFEALPDQQSISIPQSTGVVIAPTNLSSQETNIQSLPSGTTEPEPRRIRAFAKLEFDDGHFYINTYSVELGRDRRAAERAKTDIGLPSRNNSSLGDITPMFNHRRQFSSGSVGASNLSDNGGLLGFDDFGIQQARQRAKTKKTRSSSSSSRYLSRKNSLSYPEVQVDYPPFTAVPPGEISSTAPPDISTLLPPPHECPFVPIQPPNGARHQVISRQHLKIVYNPDMQKFEMVVTGRNGAFHDGEWKAPREVQPLHNGSVIQIGGTQIKFLLPQSEPSASRNKNDDSLSGKMSFQFENDRGECIMMSNSSVSSDDDGLKSYVSENHSIGLEEESSPEGSCNADEELEGQELISKSSDGEPNNKDNDITKSEDAEEPKGPEESKEERVHTRAMRRQKRSAQSNSIYQIQPESNIPKKLRLTMPAANSNRWMNGRKRNKKAQTSRNKEPNSQKRRGRHGYKWENLPEKYLQKPVEEPEVNFQLPHSGSQIQTEGNSEEVDQIDTTQDHPYSDLPPGIIIPPRRKGPGRPPKDGFMSKREKALLIRQAKEAEKSRRLGLEPGQLPASSPKSSSDKRKYTNRKLENGITSTIDKGQNSEVVSDLEAHNSFHEGDTKNSKPSHPVRSPSPIMRESDFTEVQLQRPNANYVILIHEAIKDSKLGEMNLQQIYHAIERRYPFYRFKVSTTGWQSSVRHNLQQNEAFIKIRREGKGYVWGVNPNITIEREKRKRASPPPRPYYQPYPQTHSQNLHHGSHHPHSGLHCHTHSAYPSTHIRYLPQISNTTRKGTYSSPYAPLQPSQLPASALHHMKKHVNAIGLSHQTTSTDSSNDANIACVKNVTDSFIDSYVEKATNGIDNSASSRNNISIQITRSPSHTTSANNPGLEAVSLAKHYQQQQSISSRHSPYNDLTTVMADFRQRFLGANEQSARSESIIDPIIRRFTHPNEHHDSPKPHENIIIRIIEGMLKEMQPRKLKNGVQIEDPISTGQPSVMSDDSLATDIESTDVNKGKNAKESVNHTNKTRQSCTADDDKQTSTRVVTATSTVTNGLLNSLASAAAASSATIVKSTPSSITLSNEVLDGGALLSKGLSADAQVEDDQNKASKRNISDVNEDDEKLVSGTVIGTTDMKRARPNDDA